MMVKIRHTHPIHCSSVWCSTKACADEPHVVVRPDLFRYPRATRPPLTQRRQLRTHSILVVPLRSEMLRGRPQRSQDTGILWTPTCVLLHCSRSPRCFLPLVILRSMLFFLMCAPRRVRGCVNLQLSRQSRQRNEKRQHVRCSRRPPAPRSPTGTQRRSRRGVRRRRNRQGRTGGGKGRGRGGRWNRRRTGSGDELVPPLVDALTNAIFDGLSPLDGVEVDGERKGRRWG